MQPKQASNDKQGGDDFGIITYYGGGGKFKRDKTYDELLKQSSFKWIDGKKGEGNHSWKWEHNIIENTIYYAMSERE